MREDEEPAFPRIDGIEELDHGRQSVVSTGGMSLRDYFAGQALPALIETNADQEATDIELALWAYDVAEAMLKERERRDDA